MASGAALALEHADAHARIGDEAACIGKCAFAIVAVAQARLFARRGWALNEKGVVTRAGLGDVESLLMPTTDTRRRVADVRAALGPSS